MFNTYVDIDSTGLQLADPTWYQALTTNLTTEQNKALQEVITLADQRKALAESKKIEQSGGKSNIKFETRLFGWEWLKPYSVVIKYSRTRLYQHRL